MGDASEAVTLFLGSLVIVALGYEINRKRKSLCEIYDVLDKETKHIAHQLEDMVEKGKLKPYTEQSWG